MNFDNIRTNTQKAVLFDMDGVLVDSEPVIQAAAIAGLSEYGVMAVPDDFTPFIGMGEDRYIGGVAEKYGVQYKLEMKQRVYQIYLDIVDEKLKVYEGTKKTLEYLKNKGYSMALASSADLIKIKANLRVAGIVEAYFKAIISGEDVVDKKPSPEIYLKAAAMISAEPENCVVVEDAVNGIQAAKAAGMKCIALETSFSREVLEREFPDYLCRSIENIISFMGEL